jgi:hypothetical protein
MTGLFRENSDQTAPTLRNGKGLRTHPSPPRRSAADTGLEGGPLPSRLVRDGIRPGFSARSRAPATMRLHRHPPEGSPPLPRAPDPATHSPEIPLRIARIDSTPFPPLKVLRSGDPRRIITMRRRTAQSKTPSVPRKWSLRTSGRSLPISIVSDLSASILTL